MVDISYRVMPGVGGSFDVEITRHGGRPRTAAGFGSEHEANAWIIQAQRMIREAGPWSPLVPRKASAPAIIQAPPALQAAPTQFSTTAVPATMRPPAEEPQDSNRHEERARSGIGSRKGRPKSCVQRPMPKP